MPKPKLVAAKEIAMYETIDRFIKQKRALNVKQHWDGRVQADIGDHHAQGPTLEIALRRLDEYLASLEATPSAPRR
jgi:hypothetical protein